MRWDENEEGGTIQQAPSGSAAGEVRVVVVVFVVVQCV